MTVPADVSMAPETRQALAVLHQLSEQLHIRVGDVLRWQDYYDGKQPLKFATEEYTKFFGTQYEGFRDNWCAPVVDTLAEKLTVAGLKVPASAQDDDMTADREFARVWAMNEAQEQSSQAFVEGCIARRSFALVWGNNDDPTTPEISFESPDECIVGYEPGSRRKRAAALKQWTDGKFDYATLYTPDTIWKWQRQVGQQTKLYTPDPLRRYEWIPRFYPGDDIWPIPNPSGVVPIIELANRPRLRAEPISEVEGVGAMQDAINAMWSYLFTTADFAALPQRVLLGAKLPQIPVLDSSGQPTGAFKPLSADEWMKAAASRRMQAYENPDAKIAQWDAADLNAFRDIIEFAVGHISAQTRTPPYYFANGTFSNISASGLDALGAAHIAKAKERAVYLGSGVREIAVTSYLMAGDAKAAAAARLGRTEWCEFETRSLAATADYALKLAQAGFSYDYIAGQVITDPVELADEIERHNTEQAAKAAQLEFGPKPGFDQTPPPDGLGDGGTA